MTIGVGKMKITILEICQQLDYMQHYKPECIEQPGTRLKEMQVIPAAHHTQILDAGNLIREPDTLRATGYTGLSTYSSTKDELARADMCKWDNEVGMLGKTHVGIQSDNGDGPFPVIDECDEGKPDESRCGTLCNSR